MCVARNLSANIYNRKSISRNAVELPYNVTFKGPRQSVVIAELQ